MNLELKDFDFHLPQELIANEPMVPRDMSSLLFFDGEDLEISKFRDLKSFLPENAVLVFNDTKVYKARLEFRFNDKDVELFFLGETSDGLQRCMVRPGKLFKQGAKFDLPEGIVAMVESVNEDGTRNLALSEEMNLYEYLDRNGQVPLPPYIKTSDSNKFEEQYQTVYAKDSGSVAAPTAGLHFTESLLSDLADSGFIFEYVELQVGLGTFGPLKNESVSDNTLHSEKCRLSQELADRLNGYKAEGRPVISVGTTALRTLQSAFVEGNFVAYDDETDIFIYPPFEDWGVDGLITNFHLPKSSLFILISAFIGCENALKVYKRAIDERLRFYSFGDACLFMR